MREAVRWGVDSSIPVTAELYNCVYHQLGYPHFWGRYLKTISGVSHGLTQDEINLLKNKGTKILPIYNNFENAVGYRRGTVDASNAIYFARLLGIPKDTCIFADIEDFYAIDEAWIRGWVNKFFESGFRPGFYTGPSQGDFDHAYCEAVRKNERVAAQTVIWSNDPVKETTSPRKAPKFNPSTPSCRANVWAWQYGKNALECSVNTDLAKPKLLSHLW